MKSITNFHLACIIGLIVISGVLVATVRDQQKDIRMLKIEVLETQLLHEDLALFVHSRFPALHDRVEGHYHLLFEHYPEWFYPAGNPDGLPGLSSESEGGR